MACQRRNPVRLAAAPQNPPRTFRPFPQEHNADAKTQKMSTLQIPSADEIHNLLTLGTLIFKSGLGGFKTAEQAAAALLIAANEGIAAALNEYHCINGRLGLKSECVLARFQKAGGSVEYVTRTDEEVSVVAKHPNSKAVAITWTMARARKAGLTSNSTWQKHPAAMLSARAITEAVRACYPACLSGVPEENEVTEITAGAPLSDTLPAPAPATPEPVTLTVIPQPVPEPKPTRKTRQTPTVAPAPVAAHPEPTPLPEPAPVPSAHTLRPDESDDDFTVEPDAPNFKPSPHARAFAHALDEHLAHLPQEKLTAFLIKRGLIQEGQNYKSCSPAATRRIISQMDSFLRAGGFVECAHASN